MHDLVQYFRDKQLEKSTETTMKTRCPYCSMQCSMDLIEERVVTRNRFKVKPNKNDPTSEGRLCIKGTFAHQHAINEERVHFPLMKLDGEFVRVPWELTFEMIANQMKSLQEEYGHDSVAVYGGGSLTNEEAYLLGKFARVALKTKYIDYNGRFCMSAAAFAANATFGIDRGLTNPLSEIEDSKCIILAGTNLAECQPTMLPYFKRAKKNGSKIIVIDPRKTLTAKQADIHVQIIPGMDGVFAIGLLKVMVDEGLVNYDFVTAQTDGFFEAEQMVKEISYSSIKKLTGVKLETIFEVARLFATSKTGMIFTARGVEQHANGQENVRHFLNLLLATGKIGKHACGYGAITGQGNGQGGREHGQKADQLPGYRSIENESDREYVANVWGVSPAELPRKGVSAYELFEKIDKGEIKAMFVMGSNPIVSNPNAIFVENCLKKLELLVVVDMFESETARFAHFLLPSSSYLEDEGTMTNLEGRVVYRHAERKLPAQTKHDWQILCHLAEALGVNQGFRFANSEDIFNELRIASRGGKADYSGITYENIKEKGVFWPCPEQSKGTPRLFETGFFTRNQRANFLTNFEIPKKAEVDEEYPLILTTGRLMEHYLTGVQTRRSNQLLERSLEAFVEIHPETAKHLQIVNGDLISISSRNGSAILKARLTELIREDVIFAPFHWGDLHSINRIFPPIFDPNCYMPQFKRVSVKVEPVMKTQKDAIFQSSIN
jgi:assimilatory nitrate reductase catalytic subunit